MLMLLLLLMLMLLLVEVVVRYKLTLLIAFFHLVFCVSSPTPLFQFYKKQFQSASGTGLAFILFTEAVNQFPGGNAWAVLFFLMLFTLGLDSQFGTLQGVIQCVIDLK